MRREFDLPSHDIAYLEAIGLQWETFIEAGTKWLLVQGWPVCAGYNVSSALVALQIAPGYPEAQIDMAFFSPPLARADGRAVTNLGGVTIDGKPFQQWSRHRSGENPWRAGEDDLSTHLALVEGWLEKEFRR